MARGFGPYRHQICELYLDRGLTLRKVRKEMKKQYGFDAGVRAYRYHLAKWDATRTKAPHYPIPTQLSATRPTAHPAGIPRQGARPQAPSPTETIWSEAGSYQTSDTSVSTPLSDTPVNSLQKTSLSLASQPSSPSLSTPPSAAAGIALPDPSSTVAFINEGPESQSSNSRGNSQPSSFTALSALKRGGAGPSCQIQGRSAPPIGTAPSLSRSSYSLPHAPPSRCRLARNVSSIPIVDPRKCDFCGATELHYLATISHSLDKETLTERIEVANQGARVNQCDVFGNNPGHFLAASAPTMSIIRTFCQAGIDLFKRNLAGESFLHLLDPVRLGHRLHDLLIWFHDRSPGVLTQRTYHGKTVLHCLLEQPCFLDQLRGLIALIDILPIFQSAKNDINARDNQGSTAMELFCVRWLEVKNMDERSPEELEAFHAILKVFAPDLRLLPLHDTQIPVTLVNGMAPGQHSPNNRYSNDHTLENLELRDSELRDTIAESIHNPLAQDYCGRNGLHCLASILRPLSDQSIGQPLAAQKDNLVNLLNRGVDVNAFDSRGETPLHTLLSHVRHHDEDKTIALFTKLMVLRDHGADPHLRDRNGNAALHLACKSGHVPCVEILLAMGANVDARNYSGLSAISEARKANILPEGAERIQQCLNLVREAGGVDDPLQEDDLPYYQNIHCTGPSLIENGCFLPFPWWKPHCHLQPC
jgi:hypothetical protein